MWNINLLGLFKAASAGNPCLLMVPISEQPEAQFLQSRHLGFKSTFIMETMGTLTPI